MSRAGNAKVKSHAVKHHAPNGIHTNGSSRITNTEPIAIIGMRGRFPGASELDQYWNNLANGVESITFLTPEEMRAAGVPDNVSRLPGYVNASPVLDAIDQFDAEFFGFSARDASLTDPQHRLFLETAWEALEDAGYDPARYPGSIGVFGGTEMSTYLYHLYLNRESLKYIDGMQLMVTNDKDHLCTQVSYRLNLRGPSLTVQTTCSTSLVAISLACESLWCNGCDMALAGGVTVRVPQRAGYYYTAGSILSPDGHCRPFDANAQGTIVGSGVGLVVLKRLKDALAERDHIRALILGTGINNDGNDKVGYTAPSFGGQVAAIRAAHAMAGVPVDSIGYVEAHGTGTILGDPIELSALNEAFKTGLEQRGFCGIGSVKSNFGHLSCAAGVAGLIKTVLSMEHGAIPPTVHYTAPNPAIDFVSSPFYVTKHLRPWLRNGTPRRAGVSSFGVGGTNAHVIVEEAPTQPSLSERRSHQLITLSARTEPALQETAARLGAYLHAHPALDLADVAYTLHMGRRPFRYRRVLVSSGDDSRSVADALSESTNLSANFAGADNRPVVFMFPGQGAQYPGMVSRLYTAEPVVRDAIDLCARLLKPNVNVDIRRLLFPTQRHRKDAAEALKDTKWAQPALFAVGYALADLWRSWGIQPAAMIGHSIGEYVAAALSGVMTLQDALALIARRGQLISALPRGSMLAVMAPIDSLNRFVNGDIALAAANAPGYSVLSGTKEAIERTERVLAGEAVVARRLHTSHAFHSAMMDPILGEFEDLVSEIKLSKPNVPFVATLKGEWADGSVMSPHYWAAQLRSTVRFADGMRTLAESRELAGKDPIYLEVGPGRTLATFAAECVSQNEKSPLCLTSVPAPEDRRSDDEVILSSLGQLWSNGVDINWQNFHRNERRARVSLPTYPFERQSYWIGPLPGAPATVAEARDTANWFYRPEWREDALRPREDSSLDGHRILVFDEQTGIGARVIQHLKNAGAQPIVVHRGEQYARVGEDAYSLEPAQAEDFHKLANQVCNSGTRLAGVIDCWSAAAPGETDLDAAAVVSLLAPMRLARALSDQNTMRPLHVLLIVRGSTQVLRTDTIDAPRALSIGPAKVVPQEHPGLRIAHMDIDDHESVAGQIVAELATGACEPSVALRDGRRYVEILEAMPIATAGVPHDLAECPVVAVTGGLGHMGMALAEGMFKHWGARLVLMGRTVLPPPEEWRARSEDQHISSETRRLLARLARMREQRDELLVVNADFNQPAQVRAGIDEAIARFGQIDLMIHGAARIDAAAFASVAETTPAVVEAQFSPKLRGFFYLMDALKGREPRRWILHSSISSVLGGLGLGVYSGANAMLDALALKGGNNWLSIDWDAWDNAAEAQVGSMPVAILPDEGSDAFLRLLSVNTSGRILVAVNDVVGRLKAWVRRADATSSQTAAVAMHPRPNLPTSFAEPRTETERKLAQIWSAQLGVAPIGIHDRFFDLGGHSLLAVHVSSEIRDCFQIEMPVLQMFQAPTVAELALAIDKALSSSHAGEASNRDGAASSDQTAEQAPNAPLAGEASAVAAKAGYRDFYNNVTRQLERSGVGEASFFLNYGYVSLGPGDEAPVAVPEGTFNPNSIRLAFELIGATDLRNKRVLDVGCGRGGTVALLAERFAAEASGVDLAPEAIAFCRKTHKHAACFEVGDAEHLPFGNAAFDVVTNIESSHTYPNLRAFYSEVARVLAPGGYFLYTDLLPVERWLEVRVLLGPLGLKLLNERDITRNVLTSCDEIAATRAQAFGGSNEMIDNFLAVPGSGVYEQMHSGAWEYRLLRMERV